jgi:rRNA maturation RNase YbeY
MDKKPEPTAEDDSPGRSMPGAAYADAPQFDLTDHCSLLTSNQLGDLRAHLTALMGLLAVENIAGEIRVEIVDDTRMSRMHETHKNTPGTTDVLTFDLAPTDDAVLDADILICADEASRQAQRRGHDVNRELMLYTVHAVLHCTGYDDNHDNNRGTTDMHNREDEILTSLGLGVVYHTADAENQS